MNQQQKVAATIAVSVGIAVMEQVMISRSEKKTSKHIKWMRKSAELLKLQNSLIEWVENEGPFKTKEEILKKVKDDNQYIQFVAAH